MGFSMGGWLAAELAAMCPAYMKSLVLVDAAGIKPEVGEIAEILMVSQDVVKKLRFYDPTQVPDYDTMVNRQLTPEEEAVALAQSRDDFAPVLEALFPQSQADPPIYAVCRCRRLSSGARGCHRPAELRRALPAGARQLDAAGHRSLRALSSPGETPGIPEGRAGLLSAAELTHRRATPDH